MATLANLKPSDTFDSLLHLTGETSGVTSTPKIVEDGVGTSSALALATDSVLINSTNKLEFNSDGSGEYITGDGTDLTITSGADVLLSCSRVGIGTTTPNFKLEVEALSNPTIGISATSNNTVRSGKLAFNNYGTEHFGIEYDASADYLHFDSDSAANLIVLKRTGSAFLGLGLIPTANMTGLSIEEGFITIKESGSNPTDDPDYAKIWTKSDNKLYFQSGAGVTYTIDITIVAP